MGLNKKDRRISIWFGVIIGVTLSSMLFRYAIKDKNERSQLRLGSYDSNLTAIENSPFPLVPSEIRKAIPRGLVLYHEGNQSISDAENNKTDCWIIESSGALRSERLFLLVEIQRDGKAKFFRASELYITAKTGIKETDLSRQLPADDFRILGQNERTSNSYCKLKNFHLLNLGITQEIYLVYLKNIINVRLYPWYSETMMYKIDQDTNKQYHYSRKITFNFLTRLIKNREP